MTPFFLAVIGNCDATIGSVRKLKKYENGMRYSALYPIFREKVMRGDPGVIVRTHHRADLAVEEN